MKIHGQALPTDYPNDGMMSTTRLVICCGVAGAAFGVGAFTGIAAACIGTLMVIIAWALWEIVTLAIEEMDASSRIRHERIMLEAGVRPGWMPEPEPEPAAPVAWYCRTCGAMHDGDMMPAADDVEQSIRDVRSRRGEHG